MDNDKKDEHWYAVYTAPRAEKKVSERFISLGIKHYLPMRKVKHRWSDRIKEVLLPVVNGYIFVCINNLEFNNVTKVYGAVAFVRERGTPVQIPENQICIMQKMVELSEEPIEFNSENHVRGENITVTKGPLQGMIGELVEVNGKHRVMIRINGLGCAITSVPLSFIKKN